MEQMIIAMIYLYPGALVDILRRVFFKRTYRDEETSDSTRAAKHFVFSTMISVASLLIYGEAGREKRCQPGRFAEYIFGHDGDSAFFSDFAGHDGAFFMCA